MDPEEIVEQAEAAYQSRDVDRMMELFDPEIVWYWNGWKKAEGLDEVRRLHEEVFTGDQQGDEQFQIEKTLRAASGDTIAVEWETSWTDSAGRQRTGHGGEFWTMRDGLLLEWHAYHALHDEEDHLIPQHWDETGDR